MFSKLASTIAYAEAWGLLLVLFAVVERVLLLDSRDGRRLVTTWALAVVLGTARVAHSYEGDSGMISAPVHVLVVSILHENLFSLLCVAGLLTIVDACVVAVLRRRSSSSTS